MKKMIYIITDKNGKTTDEKGNGLGWFAGNEKELCENYCKANGLTYKEKIVNFW